MSLEGTGLGTQTDAQGGDFVLRAVPAGSYILRVEAVGHASLSESVTGADELAVPVDVYTSQQIGFNGRYLYARTQIEVPW